jgi:hypothetical protein
MIGYMLVIFLGTGISKPRVMMAASPNMNFFNKIN